MEHNPDLLSARQVESVTFNTALRGYRPIDVDALTVKITESLNRYESGRRSETETMTADQVATAVFKTGLRGYDLHEVDDFLDDVVATLRYYESGGAGHHPSAGDTGEPTPQMETTSSLFERRATLSSRAPRTRPSPSVYTESDSDGWASNPDEGVVEEFRPRSSEELLDQAKKWPDRFNEPIRKRTASGGTRNAAERLGPAVGVRYWSHELSIIAIASNANRNPDQ